MTVNKNSSQPLVSYFSTETLSDSGQNEEFVFSVLKNCGKYVAERTMASRGYKLMPLGVDDSSMVTNNHMRMSWKEWISPYVNVAIHGTIACASISGIWSFLSTVNSLITYPTMHISKDVDIVDGIACSPADYSSIDKYNQTCLEIAEEMTNLTDTYPEWDCHGLVDNEVSLIDQFPKVRNLFIAMVTFTVLSAIFSIIHDWSLIYHQRRNRIQTLQFWPTDAFPMHFPVTYFILDCCAKTVVAVRQSSKCVKVSLCLCCPVVLAICMVICYILIFVLLITYLIELFLRNLMLRALCHCNPCCKGLTEVSAIWVGFARLGVLCCAHFFTFFGYVGIFDPMEDPLNDQCVCYCHYILYPTDFWKFLLAAYVLTIINFLFIRTWKKETSHHRFYLYLITYSVPIWISDAVNPVDVTSSMINEDQNGKPLKVQARHGGLTGSMQRDVSPTLDDEYAANCRRTLYVLILCITFILVSFGLFLLAQNKVPIIWGYPSAEYIIYGIYTLSGLIICSGCMSYCRKMAEIERRDSDDS